ncbi:MAG: hypothetical protein ACREB5_06850 [Sphingomonadaceae bacterium]
MSRLLLSAAALGLALAAAAPAAAQLRADKRADLSVPVKLGTGQAAIIVGFRKPDSMSAGKSGTVAFSRYDREKRDAVFQPRDAKKNGDTTTYWVLARTADKKQPLEYAVMLVSAGDYVMLGAGPGPGGQVMNTFCLGAPTFRVNAGEVVYFGDLTPYINVKLEDGSRTNAMAYSSHADDARKVLASQPDLAAVFRPAELFNEATYGCTGQMMMAYKIPGIPALEPVAVSVAAAGQFSTP